MKLLYVWIEEFRNIHQQGFAVDNEYTISFCKPDEQHYRFLDSDGHTVVGAFRPNFCRKVYFREFSFSKNSKYKRNNASLVQSVTALVGENASGKTTILECIYRRADQSDFNNKDQRYYCLVFLDEDRHCLVIRTKDVWLTNFECAKRDLRQNKGYDEYTIPLTEQSVPDVQADKDITVMVSAYQDYREETEWAYSSLGTTAYPINLSNRTIRHDFLSIFDFLCAFPALGGKENSIIFYLRDSKKDNEPRHFLKEGTTSEEYKKYFILKLAQLLFAKLRNYLYHPQPQFSMSGKQLNQISEAMVDEDKILAEQLSFLNFPYPDRDGNSLISIRLEDIPEAKIAETINILRQSTFLNSGKSSYDDYLDCLEQLFTCLYQTDATYFTGFYRLSLPFRAELRDLIEAMSRSLRFDILNGNWTEAIEVDIEWLSAGEYQRALLFSGLYDVFNSKMAGGSNADNLILLFDEPEVHMHPEAGRKFIENLTIALKEFQEHGIVKRCQLILATHSPFIIQQLADYNSGIELVEKKDGYIAWQNFNKLNQLSITTPGHYSFNLVMYSVFNVPTIELHIELYGYIQKKTGKERIAACDSYLAEHSSYNLAIHSKPDKHGKTRYKTLPTYIRNAIDHPDSKRKYTGEEFRRSIDLLIEICKELNGERSD